jgi:hypothetical protein
MPRLVPIPFRRALRVLFWAWQGSSAVAACYIVAARPLDVFLGAVAVAIPAGLAVRAFKAVRRRRLRGSPAVRPAFRPSRAWPRMRSSPRLGR